MARLALIWRTNNGMSRVRMTTTRPTMDSVHVSPLSRPKTGLSTQCQPIMIHDTMS